MKKQISIVLNKDVLSKLDKEAKEQERSRSVIIEQYCKSGSNGNNR